MDSANFKARLLAITALLLLYFGTVHGLSENGTLFLQRRKRDLPVATSEERIKLIKDALGWMTFRKDGRLMTDQELEPLFLKSFRKYYMNSKFYRTFVIAFQHGVLPKLTLNENQACNPEYTLQYKNPYNNSVTWHYQKEFTFKTFKNSPNGDDFCDYRKGLICKPATKTCRCPDGSKMQPISPGNPESRCLLEENQICSLIDLSHGGDPTHPYLAERLPEIIFNLEKPISCKHGTQCRFKSPDVTFPHCHNVNNGPWAPPYVDQFGNKFDSWRMGFARECVLGLYANPGTCDRLSRTGIGNQPGFVCYNFGPPRSLRSSSAVISTGFCAHEYGQYGISNGITMTNHHPSFYTLFSPFIHPRTVPLRGSELHEFFIKYLEIYQYFSYGGSYGIVAETEGERCSVKKTERFEKAWNYFASLENDPPPGKDYVPEATKDKLYANLQEVIDMTKNVSMKVCQIYGVLNYRVWYPPLRCVAKDPPDAAGNDGVCEEKDTTAFDEQFKKFLLDTAEAESGLANQENTYDRDILEKYLDASCNPVVGSPPPGRSVGDTLEGGYCPAEHVCYKDYSNRKDKYDRQCNLQSSMDLFYVCHESGDGVSYRECEQHWQDKLLLAVSEIVVKYSHLNKGSKCQYDIENSIRNKIADKSFTITINKYKILSWLEKTKLSGGSAGGLCDHTKLLECKKEFGICDCIKDTQPRTVTVDGEIYYSDYCYLATGGCRTNPNTELKTSDSPPKLFGSILSKSEIYGVRESYNPTSSYDECNANNLCVYVDSGSRQCTTHNTGKTGYDVKHSSHACTKELENGVLTIVMIIFTVELF